jgi:putative PIN family toxin of toxin-antitoxin system
MRVVLDTNVWIDWLVFDDPAIAALREARRSERVQILANDACIEEFERVLAYPEFKLDHAQRLALRAQLERCVVRHESLRRTERAAALPRCTDPDDQKFVTLACDAKADWLLTRDKALLRLARRLQQAGVRVAAPLEFRAGPPARE